jgi:hypothetical protein
VLDHCREVEVARGRFQQYVDRLAQQSPGPREDEAADEETDSELEKSEADVTREDLKILDDNLNSDLGEDDKLRNREYPVDMSAEDLDILYLWYYTCRLVEVRA